MVIDGKMYFDPDVHFVERHDPNPTRILSAEARAIAEASLAWHLALITEYRRWSITDQGSESDAVERFLARRH